MRSTSNFIKLLVVIVLILLDVFRYLNICSRGLPIIKTCSPDYPEFSVRLDYPEKLSDGRVKHESDGEVYPRGTWWERKGEVRGCPCSRGKPCIRKCCAMGESWFLYEDQLYCVKDDNLNFTESLAVYRERYVPSRYEEVKVSADYFDILVKGCEGSSTFPEGFMLMQDGTIMFQDSYITVHQSMFCIEFIKDTGEKVLNICELEKDFFKPYEIQQTLKWIPFLSIPILVFTLLVYALVPRLRRGYGRAIMCYLASEIFLKCDVALKESGFRKCTIIDPIFDFCSLSAQAWLVVISYITWLMACGSRLPSELECRTRFLIHCGLGWGIPFAIIALMKTADRLPGVPDIIKPSIGGKNCSIQNVAANWIYYMVPHMAGNLATLVLCVATLVRLADSRRNSEAFQNTEVRRHNVYEIPWTSLFVKVTLIMGIQHLLNTILGWINWMVSLHPAILYTCIDFGLLKGVEVFLIFVCQKDILTVFFQRLVFWRK